MDVEHYKTALIVSDPLHMKRAMLQAKDAGITAYTSPTQSSRYRTRDTKFQFHKQKRHEDSLFVPKIRQIYEL